MKKIKYEVTITMPKCDFLGNGEKYLQELIQLIQSDFDMEDEGRWRVEVKELEEENNDKHTKDNRKSEGV